MLASNYKGRITLRIFYINIYKLLNQQLSYLESIFLACC